MTSFTRQSHGVHRDPAPLIDEMSNSFHDCACMTPPPTRTPLQSECNQCEDENPLQELLHASACADICDAADAMEAAMLQVPELQDKGIDINQARPHPTSCIYFLHLRLLNCMPDSLR